MIFDSDVLIWVLRGNEKAATFVDSDFPHLVSVVSYMELVQGARDKTALRGIKSYLTDAGFETVPLSENIGHRAATYMETYTLSHGLCLPDALIGATAMEQGLTLATANRRHFAFIPGLSLRAFRP